MKKMLEIRSDVLQALVNYAYEQATTSDIDVLDFGDNELDLTSDEQLEEIQRLKMYFDILTRNGHCSIVVVPQ